MIRLMITLTSFGRASRRPLEILEAFGVEYRLNPYGRLLRPDESISLLAGVDGLIAGTETLSRDVLSHAPSLKIISRCGMGLDNVDLGAALDCGICVVHTADAHVGAVAELTLAGLLDVMRRLSYSDRLIRQGVWEKSLGSLLHNKIVGIIGLGRIGKALVRLLQPFGVTVLAYDPCQDEVFAQQHDVRYCDLDCLFSTADILTLHLPYSKAAHYLVDRARLETMKTGAVLINCSRGGLVDEIALYDFLKADKLGGAYLDTFEQEPYRGPLTELSNVVLSAHIGSYAMECRIQMEVQAVENLLQFFQAKGML